MGDISWLTVIVSVIISTITASFIAKVFYGAFLKELSRTDELFLARFKELKNETIKIIKEKS